MYQNRVHLIGYVSKNPEAKTARQSQREYTVFSLATMRAWKGTDEERRSKTELWRIVSDAGDVATHPGLQPWRRTSPKLASCDNKINCG
jgi:hypothetical protein